MRVPKPWYWAARKAWYVQINGRQHRLAADLDPKRDRKGTFMPCEEARLAYHSLMATAGQVDLDGALLPEVCEVYLGTRRGKKTLMAVYGRFLRALCKRFMTRKFKDMRPADVEHALTFEPAASWGSNTKRQWVVLVKGLFAWAKEQGYTELNVLGDYPNRYAKVSRTRVMTDDEFRLLLETAKDLEFKQIISFIRGTGCRPGEARKITRAHVDPLRPIVRLAHDEHKTGYKTGRPRFLYMPEDVETMVRTLCERYPDGPVFRNSRNGNGWGEWSLSRRFKRYRRKLGLGEEVVPYTLRHTTLSNLLDSGTSLAHTATIAGHTNPQTLMNTYYHADESLLVDAMQKIHKLKSKKIDKSEDVA